MEHQEQAGAAAAGPREEGLHTELQEQAPEWTPNAKVSAGGEPSPSDIKIHRLQCEGSTLCPPEIRGLLRGPCDASDG